MRDVFSYGAGTALYILEFSKERVMESPGFRQASEVDVRMERLSMHRPNAQFRFVNQESFQPCE
jgi:hypothetical protein